MECKCAWIEEQQKESNELIDTLWNVNIFAPFALLTIRSELIDTLWNVNTSAAEEPSGDARINRYIMECKYNSYACNDRKLSELIDTLWNVN